MALYSREFLIRDARNQMAERSRRCEHAHGHPTWKSGKACRKANGKACQVCLDEHTAYYTERGGEPWMGKCGMVPETPEEINALHELDVNSVLCSYAVGSPSIEGARLHAQRGETCAVCEIEAAAYHYQRRMKRPWAGVAASGSHGDLKERVPVSYGNYVQTSVVPCP